MSVAEGTGWARAGRRGLVVVTSRQGSQARWGAAASVQRVGALSDPEAAQVLLDLAPHAGHQGQAEALGRRLGGLPLALHVAGSYLGSEFARWSSFEAYCQALDREPASALSVSLEAEADERATVMRTWELSLDELARHGVTQSRALLRLLSCYAPTLPIPFDLLNAALLGQLVGVPEGGQAAAQSVESGLRGLSSLGLIEVAASPGSNANAVVVHPVIAATNRLHLLHPETPDPEPSLVRNAAAVLLKSGFEAVAAGGAPGWQGYQVLAPHLQAMLEETAAELDSDHVAGLLDAAGKAPLAHAWTKAPPNAEKLQEAMFRILARTSEPWPGGRGLQRHQYNLDRLMAGHRTWLLADKACREVMQAERRLLGEAHPVTQATRTELGHANFHLARWLEALGACVEALAIARRVRGENHPDTVATRYALAWATAGRGNWTEAEAIFRDVLKVQRRSLAKDHPDTLATRYALAWAAVDQGRQKEAAETFREIMDAERRMPGHDHTDPLTARYKLPQEAVLQGRRVETEVISDSAEAAFRKALEVWRQGLGIALPA